MSLNDEEALGFRQEMQAIADGKVICPCGNRDWQQFLYVRGGVRVAAGCKKCGTMFTHTSDGNWLETVKGPGRKEQSQ